MRQVPNDRPQRVDKAGPGPSWRWILLILAVIAGAALAIRCVNRNAIFKDDTVRFVEGDCYYHMRRAEMAVKNNFSVPEYDSIMNYPEGLYCRWPPLFDQLIAGFAFVLERKTPSEQAIQSAGAVLPPLLGTVTVIVVFFVSRIYLRPLFALLSTAVFSILPYHIQISVLGRPDHHVAVVLAAALFFLSAVTTPHGTSLGRLLVQSALTGAALALTLALWTGSLLFVLVMVLYIPLLQLNHVSSRKTLNLVTLEGMIVFVAALLLLWPLCTRSHWGRTGQIMWTALSIFHILLLSACTIGVISFRLIIELVRPTTNDRALRSRVMAGAGLLILGSAMTTALLKSGFLDQVSGGPAWLFKKDRFLVHIVENLPLSLSAALEDFTGLLFLFPLLVIVLVYELRRRRKPEAAIFFFSWFLVTGGSTLSQERFADLFSLSAAILVAHFFALCLDPESCVAPWRSRILTGGTRARRVVFAALLLAVTTAAARPVGLWLSRYWKSARAPHTSLNTLYDMCYWLRDNTPPAGSASSPYYDPGYSVLAVWHMGNAVAYVGQRPNVANNIGGYQDTREANIAPFRFFASDDIKEAEAILDAYAVRYIVAEEMMMSGQFARIVDILELDHGDFFNATMGANGPLYSPKQRFMQTMAVRLYLFNGKEMEHFRLVYESPHKTRATGTPTGIYKIFEYTGP